MTAQPEPSIHQVQWPDGKPATAPDFWDTLPVDYPERALVHESARHAYAILRPEVAGWIVYGLLQAPFSARESLARGVRATTRLLIHCVSCGHCIDRHSEDGCHHRLEWARTEDGRYCQCSVERSELVEARDAEGSRIS
jgi:hypothetical protein